jgi:hypothetical protein
MQTHPAGKPVSVSEQPQPSTSAPIGCRLTATTFDRRLPDCNPLIATFSFLHNFFTIDSARRVFRSEWKALFCADKFIGSIWN